MKNDLKQAENFIEDFEHEDDSQLIDGKDTISNEDFYGQMVYAGEKRGLVSEKEYELLQKEQQESDEDDLE